MKQIVREIEPNTILFRDDKNGVTWIEKDGKVLTIHSYISDAGSIRQMKKLGYWGKTDKTEKSGGYIFNISRNLSNRYGDPENYPYRKMVEDECRCECCLARRGESV